MNSMVIHAVTSQLSDAISFVSSCAAPVTKDIWKIELAVEEALVNIIEHGYCDESQKIHIQCNTTSNMFTVQIADTARPFNPTTYSGPSEEPFERGRGIRLMRAVTDRMEYYRDDQINILTLKKLI